MLLALNLMASVAVSMCSKSPQYGSTAPNASTNPINGLMYIDLSSSKIYLWTGTGWKLQGSTPGDGSASTVNSEDGTALTVKCKTLWEGPNMGAGQVDSINNQVITAFDYNAEAIFNFEHDGRLINEDSVPISVTMSQVNGKIAFTVDGVQVPNKVSYSIWFPVNALVCV